MNKKIILSLLGILLFPIINNNLILESEASNTSKTQEDLSPLITYTTEQIGDREKMKVTVTVEDRSGSGIKEFRDYNNNLVNGDSYTFEINRRGNYVFTAIDNNNNESNIKIDDSWVNPYTGNLQGRVFYGSGYWSSSNLREWLNSDDEIVNYTCNPPSKEFMGDDAYDKEPGFLTNFTDEEKNAIAVTERRILISSIDKIIQDGGNIKDLEHPNMPAPNFLASISSYAFNYKNMGYKIEKDKVFILNFSELYWYLSQRGLSYKKEITQEAKEKYNYSSDFSNWITQWSSPWSNYDRTTSVKTDNYLFTQHNSISKSGIVPALHINPDYILNDGRRVGDLNILDKLFFGSYLDSPIEWQIINISDEGYPLLLSTKVIDLKRLDAKGDLSRGYSDYILFDEADVSIVDDLEYKSTSLSSDINIPTVNIINEEELNKRQNGPYTVDFNIVDDESGIDYVITPDGNKLNTGNFSYTVGKNNTGANFKIMDRAGNYLESYIPISNINQEPNVIINVSDSNWSKDDVYIDINTSNEVIARFKTFYYTNVNTSMPSFNFPNYTSYNGARFLISGKAKLLYLDERAMSGHLQFGMVFKSKKLSEYGYKAEFSYDRRKVIALKDLVLDEYIDFEYIYEVPESYAHSLSASAESDVSSINGELFKVEVADLKYELIDSPNTSFNIEEIILPNGESINGSSYCDIISTDGIHNLTYRILDSRGKETTKTITTKIDKTAPTLNLEYDTSNITNQSIVVNISASDATSGVKRIKLPNGNYITNLNSTYTISGDGSYTFECEDVAGNITTKTIVIDNIDKDSPNVAVDKNKAEWTNGPVQIKINARD